MIGIGSSTGRGLVKICGLRQPEHAVAAVLSGADLIGFMFAPSKRRVDHGQARACLEAARSVAGAGSVLAVGIFVDASRQEIESAVEVVGLDLVQLHCTSPGASALRQGSGVGDGDGVAEACFRNAAGSSIPIVEAISTPPGTNVADVVRRIRARGSNGSPPVAWLIDGYVPGSHGGTGQRADWGLAAEVAAVAPLILAGGLTPTNVGEAIRIVRPLGVDVSGGVETDGSKDPEKIASFIRAARAAFDGVDVARG